VPAAMPRLNINDFNSKVTNGSLTISGEWKFVNEDRARTFHAVETKLGSCSRSFQLPDIANAAGMETAYVNIIWQVMVPKDESKLLKTKIEVK